MFFKVGLLTTVGLSTQNAILIIEFALDVQKQGKGLIEAIHAAVKLRLRPILMTSMAFVLGVVPSLDPVKSPISADIAWQKFFTDPRLRKLVETSLANNRDLFPTVAGFGSPARSTP